MLMRMLAVLAVLLLAPGALAQLPGAVIAEDPAGDQKVTAGPADPMSPPGRWSSLDLLGGSLEETKEAFLVHLKLTDLDPDGENVLIVDSIRYHAYFTFKDSEYRIRASRATAFPLASDVAYSASLQRLDNGTSRWSFLSGLENTADTASNIWHITVPRQLVLDSFGAAPGIGDVLTDFYVTSELVTQGAEVEGQSVRGNDRMPDGGVADFVWEIQHGITQSGHARLSSAQPVRSSNGEATTFLYEIEAHNLADRPDTFKLSATGMPSHWVVTFPQETVRIGEEDSVKLPVLLTVPFAHEHGAFIPVLLELQSRSDPLSVGRMEIGVRYTAVPQPAGHHNELFFHSEGGTFGGEVYMNTVEDFDGDQNIEVASRFTNCGFTTKTHYWTVYLSPRLEMGLDFDLAGTGTIQVPMKTKSPLLGAVLDGGLYVYTPEPDSFTFRQPEEKMVAQVQATAPVDMQPDAAHVFQTTVTPLEFGNYIPYEDGMVMVLELRLTDNTPAGFVCFGFSFTGIGPAITPGGQVTLPLNEYHDDVDEFFSALSGVDLYSNDQQQKLVNPGKTVLFNITMENIGTTKGSYELELTGSHVEWARIVGPTGLSLGAGESRVLQVAVAAPASAVDGELADVTFHAKLKTDPNVRSLIRLLAEVDVDEQHPDMAGQEQEVAKKSPGIGLALLVGLVGLAARTRRKR